MSTETLERAPANELGFNDIQAFLYAEVSRSP